MVQAVRGSSLEAVPNYGGSSPTSAQGMQGAGLGSIKTPRQLVAELDKHVVGQEHAKKVRPHVLSTGNVSKLRDIMLKPIGVLLQSCALACSTFEGAARPAQLRCAWW